MSDSDYDSDSENVCYLYHLIVLDCCPCLSRDVAKLIASFLDSIVVPSSHWVVTFTHFTDDYKPRGDDWSHMEGPYLFCSYAKAEAFLRRELYDWAVEETHSMGEDNIDNIKRARKDLKQLEKIVAEKASGEYVSRRFAWKLEEVECYDENVESSSDDDESEADEDNMCDDSMVDD